ncbi:MAG: cytochrome c biogenesis protein DipZ [Candidatus Nomurabacteria bacterium]|nr:MAG: cytochrome c biogenesis protein DipZ [Candidatus Nomurabacteria bacterium]
MLLLIGFAFLAGVVTVLSPCILPILPVILTGSVTGSKRRPLGIVLGFILSFSFFTLFLATIVQSTGISAGALRTFSIVVLFGFGVSLLFPRVQVWLEQLFSRLSSRAPRQANRTGFWGGILIGLSIGLLWTPCVGPILASVISLALTGSVSSGAAFITLAYAIGTAIPMLAIMYGGRHLLQRVPWLMQNTGRIQKAFGVFMIITAIGISANLDRKFQTFILDTFPNYGIGLTKIEDNEQVQQELDKLNAEPNEDIQGKPMNEATQSKKEDTPAPELIPGGEWFNSDPLSLKELRGKVVLVDFWTYSCINCQRTLPYLRDWWEKYKDDGLVIIGVHTPEFEFEKDPDNVAKALRDYEIDYPVMQDNNFATWSAYKNRYWPRKYLVDQNGNIIYDHIGEGGYEETERQIQEALQNAGKSVNASISTETTDTDFTQIATPELYFGSARNQYLGNGTQFQTGSQELTLPDDMKKNMLYLSGTWNFQDEYATNSNTASITLPYQAKNVYMVAAADNAVQLQLKLDGENLSSTQTGADVDKNGQVTIQAHTLYHLISTENYGSHTLTIEIPAAGLEAYTFTFG